MVRRCHCTVGRRTAYVAIAAGAVLDITAATTTNAANADASAATTNFSVNGVWIATATLTAAAIIVTST